MFLDALLYQGGVEIVQGADMLRFDNLTGSFAGGPIAGALSFDGTKAIPKLSGALALPSIDSRFLTELALGTDAWSATDGSPTSTWPSAAFGPPLLGGLNLDVKVASDTLVWGEDLHGVYLEDLYVAPEFRGKGIGKALLQHLARLCVARDLGHFQWWVLDWNAPSIAFYESLGAVPQDEWTVMRVSGDALRRLAEVS